MASIDAELATLHARIAQLEEAKKIPQPPKPMLEELITRKEKGIEKENNYTPRNRSLTAINTYRSDIEMLESIVESLNRIHARLDALEKK